METKIIEKCISIKEAISNIRDGKYVMPVFQRQYEWNLYQIEKLWDSILLDYPISTFLLWRLDSENTTKDTKFCTFLKDVVFDSRKTADTLNYDTSFIDLDLTNTAVLDGQQRLTSLFISLFGCAKIRQKYSRKNTKNFTLCKLLIELDSNKIDVNEEEYNSKKFDIKFSEKVMMMSPTQFEIKKIMDKKFENKETRTESIEDSIKFVSDNSKDYARNILNKLCSKIYDEKIIRITEILNMNQDDALEMFVRFNSGGKKLSKSTITMSILDVYWSDAKEKIGNLLNNEFDGFDPDFIIRTALMLYGDVVKTTINKSIANSLKYKWDSFKDALIKLKEMFVELNIDIKRFKSSWNVLLPIIYVIYYNDDYKKDIHAIKSYLIRAILFSYFASGTTGKLHQMRTNIINYNYRITTEMLDAIGPLSITESRIEDIVNSEKGSRIAGEALYYLGLDWAGTSKLNLEQDHLHPFNRFEKDGPLNVSRDDWKNWRQLRNKLPNIHLLYWRANDQKTEIPLEDYYEGLSLDQQTEFRYTAILPDDVSLSIDNFNIFYNKRKELLIEKLKQILI